MEKDTKGRYIQGWAKDLWSRKHKSCIQCGGTKYKHHGYGLCRKCFEKSPTYLASVKKYRASGKWKKLKKHLDITLKETQNVFVVEKKIIGFYLSTILTVVVGNIILLLRVIKSVNGYVNMIIPAVSRFYVITVIWGKGSTVNVHIK